MFILIKPNQRSDLLRKVDKRVGPVAADVAKVGKLSFDVSFLHVVDQMSAQPKALLTDPKNVSK